MTRPAVASSAALLDAVAARARASGVFGAVVSGVGVAGPRLECAAKESSAPAFYRLDTEAAGLRLSMVTPDRWLSESVESDLEHTGDHIEELLADELIELGVDGVELKVDHYRSEDKLFTFSSPLPAALTGSPPDAERVCVLLLAYEACFRRLGDMAAGPGNG
ncbi:MAG: hypothetical protein JNM07_09420 [Phycisphaerae bacterium]|nr:hypothetical protein [Phycisphaerae bacterium]